MSAIEKTNLMFAAGNVTMGNPPTVNFQNGCVVARTGAGVYTITLDTPLANSAAVLLIKEIVAANVACVLSVVQTSNTVWTVTTSATLGGAAADIVGGFNFAVFGVGAPGSSGV